RPGATRRNATRRDETRLCRFRFAGVHSAVKTSRRSDTATRPDVKNITSRWVGSTSSGRGLRRRPLREAYVGALLKGLT
ncbi:hypothetical protein LSAT2_002217, partial [Lamellibrachia satsuma]